MQSILIIICGFSLGEFAYLLKFIYNPQINTALTQLFAGLCRVAKNLSCLPYVFLRGKTSLSSLFLCVSALIQK